ncbi:hypothetical protein EST54_21070 [Streptomyces sioyaensis]|uniref:Uncharacterized protein n=1 Tax=Streptomyces sioyaensis TaxID=67364 RepID=A0A4Q1QXT1_9ACTN|nr:hypothetical protein EST54_21070 [Streptomyces sioyaensis]
MPRTPYAPPRKTAGAPPPQTGGGRPLPNARLPLAADRSSRVSSVDLMVHSGAKWQERASFALLE